MSEWEVVRGGLDSLAWLLNNAHNRDADNWPDLVKSAREDRDRALIALDVLRLQNQALQERAEKAEAALKEAQVIIGAAAVSAGGFLRITRKAMTEIDLNGELSSWGEPDCIVYTYHALSPTQETDPEPIGEPGVDWVDEDHPCKRCGQIMPHTHDLRPTRETDPE